MHDATVKKTRKVKIQWCNKIEQIYRLPLNIVYGSAMDTGAHRRSYCTASEIHNIS